MTKPAFIGWPNISHGVPSLTLGANRVYVPGNLTVKGELYYAQGKALGTEHPMASTPTVVVPEFRQGNSMTGNQYFTGAPLEGDWEFGGESNIEGDIIFFQ